jgi:hypothetical protein
MSHKISINMTLVDVDGQFLERDGIRISDFADESKHTAVTGTVVACSKSKLCQEVVYNEYGIHGPLSPGAPDKAMVAELSEGVYDEYCPFYAGDRVMFRYPSLMQADDDGLFLSDNEVFISYGHIVGYWNGESFFTVNKYLMVEPLAGDDSVRNGIADVSAADEKVGIGVVRYGGVGCEMIGRVVIYEKLATRTEVPIHSLLISERPLLRIKETELLGYYHQE